jgi:hypothetical protein
LKQKSRSAPEGARIGLLAKASLAYCWLALDDLVKEIAALFGLYDLVFSAPSILKYDYLFWELALTIENDFSPFQMVLDQ